MSDKKTRSASKDVKDIKLKRGQGGKSAKKDTKKGNRRGAKESTKESAKESALKAPQVSKYDSHTYLVKRVIKENIVPHTFTFVIAIALMVVVAGATAGHAYLLKPAIDLMFNNSNRTLLLVMPVIIFIVTIIKTGSTYLQAVIMQVLTNRITTDMQMRLYVHFIRSDISMYNHKSSGYMISNMTNDINFVMQAINVILNGLIKQLLTVVFLVAVMFVQNFELSLIAFVGFPLAAYPIIAIAKRLKKLTAKTQTGLEQFTAQMDDTLKSSRLVKAYNAENFEIGRMSNILEDLFKIRKKIAKVSLLGSPLVETLGGVGVALVIWYGGYQVMEGIRTPGSFFSFFGAMMMAYRPMKSLAGLNVAFQMGLIGAKKLFTMMDEKPQIVDKPGAIELKKVKGDIEFKNVHFRYIADKIALSGVNLKVGAGQMVALVGHSGGGKSTIMNMILRFYDPESGSITLDGHDLRKIKLSSLRNSMSVVSQEVQLFDDTIKNNIKYGKVSATDEEIIQAAKMANAHEFISELQDGYNTVIGQSGIRLSGGQRQRISIARAILYNAEILLLDEATSALDPISERLIKNALGKLMKGRTSIVIAHRLSTVINADKICVISNGKLVEEGTHEELLRKNGTYSSLYHQQLDKEDSQEGS